MPTRSTSLRRRRPKGPGTTRARSFTSPSLEQLLDQGDRLLVGYAGLKPVACGAVRRLDARTGELKRMFVVPEQRGRGIGRRLLHALECEARDLGFDRIVLDTEASRHEAIQLYETSGYRAIVDYNGNQLADRWFEKPF